MCEKSCVMMRHECSELRIYVHSTQLWWSQSVSSCSWKNTAHEHFHIVWLIYRLTALHASIVCACVFEIVVYLIQCVLRTLRWINQSNNVLTEFHSSFHHIIYCLFSKEITLSQWFINCSTTRRYPCIVGWELKKFSKRNCSWNCECKLKTARICRGAH